MCLLICFRELHLRFIIMYLIFLDYYISRGSVVQCKESSIVGVDYMN